MGPARGDDNRDHRLEPRVDADFADEHVDGGHQVGVQFLGPYLAYAGVDPRGWGE